MSKQPKLFKVRPIDQGKIQLTVYAHGDDGFDVRVKGGVLYVSLTKDDAAALRDVLSAALTE